MHDDSRLSKEYKYYVEKSTEWSAIYDNIHSSFARLLINSLIIINSGALFATAPILSGIKSFSKYSIITSSFLYVFGVLFALGSGLSAYYNFRHVSDMKDKIAYKNWLYEQKNHYLYKIENLVNMPNITNDIIRLINDNIDDLSRNIKYANEDIERLSIIIDETLLMSIVAGLISAILFFLGCGALLWGIMK